MSDAVRFLASKTQSQITHEWDKIAPDRDAQIAANNDTTFTRVLEPWILARVHGGESIVDVGCGTGRLTAKLRQHTMSVLGLDPSPKSIEIARSHDASGRYVVATVQDWVAKHPTYSAELVVANMVLMDSLNLDEVCAAIAHLARNGRVVATITHPAFWPFYWGYATNPGFDYMVETLVEAPFRTRSHAFSLPATHVHRPLKAYLDAFKLHGLQLSEFEELRGPESPSVFPFPRFIGLVATPRPR